MQKPQKNPNLHNLGADLAIVTGSAFSSAASIKEIFPPLLPTFSTHHLCQIERGWKISSASHQEKAVRVNGAMAREFPRSGCQEVIVSGKETERSSHAGRQSSETFRIVIDQSSDHQLMRNGQNIHWYLTTLAKLLPLLWFAEIIFYHQLAVRLTALHWEMSKTASRWSAAEKKWTFVKRRISLSFLGQKLFSCTNWCVETEYNVSICVWSP